MLIRYVSKGKFDPKLLKNIFKHLTITFFIPVELMYIVS